MIDLQAVYIRDFIRLQYVEPLVLIRVLARTPNRAALLKNTESVSLGGSSAAFFTVPNGDVLIHVPGDVYVGAGIVYSINSPGLPMDVVVKAKDPVSGEILTETIQPADILLDDRNLQVQGQDFTNAVQVLINKQSAGFAVLNKNYLVCTIPDGVDALDSLEVIASSARITVRIPPSKFPRSIDSFGACALSSGGVKPRSTTGSESSRWKSAAIGIEPPSRM